MENHSLSSAKAALNQLDRERDTLQKTIELKEAKYTLEKLDRERDLIKKRMENLRALLQK